jgi:tetratricopeptide (TPR) repeat protein
MIDTSSEEGSWVVGTIKRALEADMIDHAAQVYEESGVAEGDGVLEALKAAAPLRDPGARMFLQARDFARAARLYESLNLWQKAAAQYEEATELGEAARCWQKGGDLARAATDYDAAGMHQQAVPLFQKLGDHAQAARALLKTGRAADAARLYQKLGNVRGEVDALRAVKPNEPEHLESVKRLVSVLASRGRPAEATQVASDAIRDSAAARGDSDLNQALMELHLKQGQHEQAEKVRARFAGTQQRATPPRAAPPPPDATTQISTAPGGYSFLKAIPLFAKLSIDDMKDLYRLMDEEKFDIGDIIIESGIDGRGLFVVVEGKVDIYAVTPTGTKRLNTLGAGAYFGEVSLLGKAKTSARVSAVQPVQALHIAPDQFERFLNTRPNAALRVYRLFAEGLAERVRALSTR